MRSEWTPFNTKGKVRVTLYTDPWWKRLRAKLRREPLWHKIGAIKEEEEQ